MTLIVGPWTINGFEALAALLAFAGVWFLVATVVVIPRNLGVAIVGAGLTAFGLVGSALVVRTLWALQGPLVGYPVPEPVDLSGARHAVRYPPADVCFAPMTDPTGCADPAARVSFVGASEQATGIRTGASIAVANGPRMFGAIALEAGEGDPVHVVVDAEGGSIDGGPHLVTAALHEAITTLPRRPVRIEPTDRATVQRFVSTCLSARPRPCDRAPDAQRPPERER